MYPLWIHQHKDRGLGDFVIMTPALKAASEFFGQPMPVYFDSPDFSLLYQKCDFIRRLETKPSWKAWCSTKLPLKYPHEPANNYEGYPFTLLSLPLDYAPYIDQCQSKTYQRDNRPHVAIINGNGSPKERFRYNKDLGPSTRQYVISRVLEMGGVPVILGNQSDHENYWQFNDLSGAKNFIGQSLYESVAILQQCDLFISNDTMLYHAASASGIGGMVIWRDTDMRMFRNPYEKRAFHLDLASKAKYPPIIDQFLQKNWPLTAGS